MALIIEGADNLGKTTAAKRLVELANERGKFPVRYGHMSRPPKHFDFCHDYRHWTTPFTVQDRFHLGGLVWHQNAITPEGLRLIESHLMAEGSVIVVFSVPARDETWYYDRLKSANRDEMFSPETIIAANQKFQLMTKTPIPSVAEMHGIPVFSTIPVVDISIEIGPNRFAEEETLEYIVDTWFKRLETCHGFRPRTA